jgi:hypothetical protein
VKRTIIPILAAFILVAMFLSGCSSDKSILKTVPGVSLLTQAEQSLGTQFPRPLSLPDGYEVTSIALGQSNNQVVFEIASANNTLTLRVWGGSIIPIKNMNDEIVSFNNWIGYFADRTDDKLLSWDMSPSTQPAKTDGWTLFEVTLQASKNTPKEDILAIAKGVGWED